MAENNFVPNEVFVYSVWFQHYIDISVYVKPFPEDYSLTDEEMEKVVKKHEDLVQSKYFTKERIEELKKEFIKKIQESDNPFKISCVDIDGGYEITEEKLFNLE